MHITNQIHSYISFSEDSLVDALKKISANKSRIIYIVSEHGVLQGSLSDGDVRRWLVNSPNIDLMVPVNEVMNRNCIKIQDRNRQDLTSLFVEGVTSIPIIDDAGHLIKISFSDSDGFYIGERLVAETAPAFIIAEIGNNHQGDIKLAKKLVDHAVEAGADCAKFQMRNLKQLYKNSGDRNNDSADLGAQYTMDLLSKFQLDNEELTEVFDYCKSQNILPLCTPWDLDSLIALEEYDMPAYKVASADFTNYELLKAISLTGKPFFVSTGMSNEIEIKSGAAFLDSLGANYVLLHCNSTYPTPFKDVNLNYLSRLKKITGKMVGYSGHERGIETPIAAIAMGACVIEKHLTTDKQLEGTDHKVSLLPDELTDMVRMIRNLEQALGDKDKPREISQGELMNRENLAKSLVAANPLKSGSIITRNIISIKSPGQGLQPNRIDELIGKTLTRDVEEGGFFYNSDIQGQVVKKSAYKFSRPFGVPVRYHDYNRITENSNLDFVEFHLSYNDLKVKLTDYFSHPQEIGFAVHSPELFANDHILDLCAQDASYREKSIELLAEVIAITKQLKQYFPQTKTPVIIVNAGGWSPNGFMPVEERAKKYDLISSSLSKLDLKGVCLSIQTMPPFPWHFGGQSYHNLFVNADEIRSFCNSNPMIKICLDISHSMMACNYYGWDLLDFVEKIAPYNVHLHVVDAKGSDGEGVEIGAGDVNFEELIRLLAQVNPRVQFIPEVWQGHKNGGEGFWKALDYLESKGL